MQTSEAMYVDMKMSITTLGAHNGLIVHSGVQCGSQQSSSIIWPYSGAAQVPSLPTVQFAPTPTPARESLQWRKELSPPPSPTYSFDRPESPPSEFIKPDNVQLNVFQVDPTDLSDAELRRTEPKRASTFQPTREELLNDTVTTTTTVEVFRANVDPNNPNEYLVLPPVPAPGFDGRPQVLQAIGPEYEKWSDSRTETLINDPRQRWIATGPSITSPGVSPTPPVGVPLRDMRAVMPSSAAYSPPASRGVTNGQFDSLPRRQEDAYSGSAPFKEHVTAQQRAPSAELGGGHLGSTRFDPEQRARRPQSALKSSLASPQLSAHRAQAAIAVRDRDDSLKRPSRNATSSEIFHLYQTRDALGNVRAQCDIGIDLCEEEMTAVAPLVDSEDSIISETSARGDSSRSDVLVNVDDVETPLAQHEIPSPSTDTTMDSRIADVAPDQPAEGQGPSSFGFFEVLPPSVAQPATAFYSVSPADTEEKSATEVDGRSSSEEALSSVPDLSACPSKSILHVVRRPVRHGRRAPKTVRFPSRQSQVTVKDHRLFITDLDSDSDETV